MKKTKIICTMGPNTNDRELVKQMALAGMDIARFNFSHGDHEEQKGRVDIIKSVRDELGIPIAMLLDTRDLRSVQVSLRTILSLISRMVRSSHLQQEILSVMRMKYLLLIRVFLLM